MRVRPVLLLPALIAVFAGCGSDEGADTTTEAKKPSASPTATAAATTEPVAPSRQPGAVDAAERAVKTDLGDSPIWKGTVLTGRATSDTEVCIDRKVTAEVAEDLGFKTRTSHVVVAVPGNRIGEPQDGPCVKAAETAEKANEAGKAFYLKLDDLALQLDDAIAAAQKSEAGAVDRLASLGKRIAKAVTDYTLTGETSIGGNGIQSDATTAVEAARTGDVQRLAQMRARLRDDRSKLAEEAIK